MSWLADQPLSRWMLALILAGSLSTGACVFDTEDDADTDEVEVEDDENGDTDVETEVEVEPTP